MQFIRNLKDLTFTDSIIAGGKAASLSNLIQSGFIVPTGFVILSSVFDDFFQKNLKTAITKIFAQLNYQNSSEIKAVSQQIQSLIESTKFPENLEESILENFKQLQSSSVAVRSSATSEDGQSHSWAGQLSTYLNTTETNLLENIKKCWASLFNPQAIFYRFENNLQNQNISVAVIVQAMIESEVSGIAFSVHPVTENSDQIIIEAIYGLGEAIVSGQLTPDTYVTAKSSQQIISINIAPQTQALVKTSTGNNWQNLPAPQQNTQKLSESQILQLSEIIIQIEKRFQYPCDIEWALQNNQFYILQARPITTLS